MPARSPFTQLCQAALASPKSDRADLHLHSTASDGRYTPAQVVEVARRTGLAAIALTDHDTLAGYEPARLAAGERIEVISAVELSCERAGREVHLLAYFVRPDHPALNQALDRMRDHRVGRYAEMVAKLRRLKVDVPDVVASDTSLGRRHLAEALVKSGKVGTVREAFNRYLDDGGPADVPKLRLDLAEAIALVRSAGGVTSYAHPLPRVDRNELSEMVALGLHAVEAEYPGFHRSRTAELRQWARELGLAVTGGSDCHGPDEPRRGIGAVTVAKSDLDQLRAMA
jgi:predicted metal-dependent phosphoesterase TrpH